MGQTSNKFTRLVHELRRRKTFRAAATYIVFAWVLIEGASVVLPAFAAPTWVLPAFIVTLTMGLPVAVVVSWIFDFTLGGFERTGPELESDVPPGPGPAKPIPAAVKPSIALPLGSASRRQVTLLRCSFELVCEHRSVSDPEALMALRDVFDDLIDSTGEHFSGVCIDRSGLSYELLFGYPEAFENDAMRACAAAFSVQHRLTSIHVPSSKFADAELAASVGIHSDTVIIEQADGNDIRVIGDISQVATWLQAIAASGSITLSEDTQALLRDTVSTHSLGKKKNHHTSSKMQVYQAESLLPHDVAELLMPGVHPDMVGRESELALLLDRWRLAKEGEDQFVMLRGEPGIGKSTLIRELIKRTRGAEDATVIPLFCSSFESTSPFHPILEYFLGPTLGSVDERAQDEQLRHMARLMEIPGLSQADADSLRSSLLTYASIEQANVPSGKSAVRRRRDLQRFLVRYFSAASRNNHLLIVVEDIQWADPSTLEFVDMLVGEVVGVGMLCVFAGRPETKYDWMSRTDVLVLDLQRLPRQVTEVLVRKVAADKELDEDALDRIVSESDGNPMFAEELTRALLRHHYDSADEFILPGSVQQLLASKMDKLGSALPVLQLCSLLGKRFDYKLLLAVSDTENEKGLQKDLRTLVNAGLLFQSGAFPDCSYRFRHILMQEAAHRSLLRATRAEQHARIAEIIELYFTEKVQRRPELLAYHYSEGGKPREAVFYRIKAARKALQAYALHEAVEQSDKGLATLQSVPVSDERGPLEVTLQSLRAKALLSIKGYGDPSVERAFAQALTLTENLEDSPQLFQLIVGLWMYFFIAGEAEHAIELAHRLNRIAARIDSPAKALQAQYCLGHSLFRLGYLKDSLEHLEMALDLESGEDDFASESASGDDTRIHIRAVMSHVLWHLGDDVRALAMSRESRTMAEELGNPFGIVFAAFMSSWLCMVRGDATHCAVHAARTIHIAEERGFSFWVPLGYFMQAWASCDRGSQGSEEELEARIESMENYMNVFTRGGGTNGETTLSLQIAEDCLTLGLLDKASTWLNRAKNIMAETGEVFMSPDVTRVEGLLLACRGDLAGAEKKFLAAREISDERGSASLGCRADVALDALHSGAYGGYPEQRIAVPEPAGPASDTGGDARPAAREAAAD